MGLPRLFVDTPLAPNTTITPSEAITRHIHVLYSAVSDDVCLLDGPGHEFRAQFDTVNKRDTIISLTDTTQPDTETCYTTMLAQGTASGDRMDWLIEKAVELGINAAALLRVECAVVRLSGECAAKRVQHWQAPMQAACEQCGRTCVPAVALAGTLHEWLTAARSIDAPRILLSPRDMQLLTQWAVQSCTRTEGSDIILPIDPEGSLSPDEEVLIKSVGFLPLTPGRRILKTKSIVSVTVSVPHAVFDEFWVLTTKY